MKSPLALLEIKQKGKKVWKVVQTHKAARGTSASRAVFIRDPTKKEQATIMRCLGNNEGDCAWCLEGVLQHFEGLTGSSSLTTTITTSEAPE